MCNCMAWCRTPTDENGGRFPLSEHHPNCEDFAQEEFSRIELHGTFCIVPKGAEEDIIGDCENKEEFIVTKVMLTRDQFERLPEFDGF